NRQTLAGVAQKLRRLRDRRPRHGSAKIGYKATLRYRVEDGTRSNDEGAKKRNKDKRS
ncbi:hypothetical protein J6590_099642, partial [Homalodisca vitripennis]